MYIQPILIQWPNLLVYHVMILQKWRLGTRRQKNGRRFAFFLHLYFGIGQLLGNYTLLSIPFYWQEWSWAPLTFEFNFLESWLSSLTNMLHLIASINCLCKMVNFMAFFITGKLNVSMQCAHPQIIRGGAGALIDQYSEW